MMIVLYLLYECNTTDKLKQMYVYTHHIHLVLIKSFSDIIADNRCEH